MSATSWRVELSAAAQKALDKLGAAENRRIVEYLRDNIATGSDPERFGKALTGRLKYIWRYRVGNFRILARIEKERVVVLVIEIGHRSKVYR